MNALKRFYDDKEAMKAWADFIIAELNEEALRRVYKGEDTSALKEASEVVAQSFKKLGSLYAPKRKPKPPTRAV